MRHALIHFRGYVDDFPTLPLVVLPMTIVLCFYAGLM